MRSILLLPLLAGCPYLFDAPDLGNVDAGVPGDTDDTDDTDIDTVPDTDTETDTDTDVTPTIPGDPPTLTSGEVTLVHIDHLELAFSVVDPDADLLGGMVELLDGTNVLQTWSIPDQIIPWDPVGVNRVEHYVPIPCTGYAPDLQLVVTDFAGHVSAPLAVPLEVVPVAAPSSSSTVVALAVPSVPATWCSTGNLVNADANPVEDDYFTFSNPTSSELLISADWDPALLVDIDVLLYTTPGPPNGFVKGATTISFDGHEQLKSKGMAAQGTEFGVMVETWGFSDMSPIPSGPWPYQVIVQESP